MDIHRTLGKTFLSMVVAGAVCAQSATPCWESSLGTDLGLSDNSVSTRSLGFTFNGPSGPVSQVVVSSNGFVWLAPSTSSACCSGSTSQFLGGLPRIAPLWTDLDPSAGGGVYFRSILTGGTPRAVITWDRVRERSSTAVVSTQLQLLADGTVLMTFLPGSEIRSHSALTGVTQGNGAALNSVDLSGVSAAPIFSGTNATVHEEFAGGSFDLGGMGLAFVPNGQGGYIVVERSNCGFASLRTFGTGCPEGPESFYEQFARGTFDLSGAPPGSAGFVMVATGPGTYTVQSGSGSWFTPGSTILPMRDDIVVQQSLPFPFPYRGGVTSTLWICSNGYIWLQSSSLADYTPTVAEFLSLGPRLCPLWTDLNPGTTSGGAGAVHYDVDPSGSTVYVTWNGVGEYGVTGSSNTFQVALSRSGSVDFRYRSTGAQIHSMLTGWSPGGGIADPGNTDLSSSLPFRTGNGSVPLELAASPGSRPTLGSTFRLAVGSVPPGSLLAFLAFGFQQQIPPIDLGPLGMPGCFQYVSLDSGVSVPPTVPTTLIALTIPTSTTLTGLRAYTQAAVVAPGTNQLGLITSNGAVMQLGN